jgi:MarR family 2-MHQ and catechol resistance regulon transcriptional repressor
VSGEDDISGVHLWLLLMKAHRALGRRAEESIAETGLCFSDFAILEMLLHKGPLPVNTIGAAVPLTSGSATTAADRLAGRGLVRRAADPRDLRTRVLHLTSEGRKLIQAAFARHRADMEEAVSSLSDRERAALIRLLRKLGKSSAEGSRKSTQKGVTNDVQPVPDE